VKIIEPCHLKMGAKGGRPSKGAFGPSSFRPTLCDYPDRVPRVIALRLGFCGTRSDDANDARYRPTKSCVSEEGQPDSCRNRKTTQCCLAKLTNPACAVGTLSRFLLPKSSLIGPLRKSKSCYKDRSLIFGACSASAPSKHDLSRRSAASPASPWLSRPYDEHDPCSHAVALTATIRSVASISVAQFRSA
jgi:hypothetical protein